MVRKRSNVKDETASTSPKVVEAATAENQPSLDSSATSLKSLLTSMDKTDPRWPSISRYIFDIAGGMQGIAAVGLNTPRPATENKEMIKNRATDPTGDNTGERTNRTSGTSASCNREDVSTNSASSHGSSSTAIPNEHANRSKEDASNNAESNKDNETVKYWKDIGLTDSRNACVNLLNFGIGAALVDRLEDFVVGVASSHPRDPLAVLQLLALAALDGYESASSIAIRTDSATAARLRKLRSTAPASVGKGRSYSGESSESNPFDEIDEEDDESDAVLHCDPGISFLSGIFSSYGDRDGGPQLVFSTRNPVMAESDQRIHRSHHSLQGEEATGLYRHISNLASWGRRNALSSSGSSSSLPSTSASGTSNQIYSNKRWPMVGDNVMARYYGEHERLNGRFCEAHVIANNADDTFVVQWRDADDDTSVICGDPAAGMMKIKFPQQRVRVQTISSYMMKRAIPSNDLPLLGKLIGDGADVNYTDELGHTPLTLAIACACTYDFLKYLLDAGANVEGKGPLGTPLEMAIKCGTNNVELLLLLLHHGADTSSINLHDIKYAQMKEIVRSFEDIQLDSVIRELIVSHQRFVGSKGSTKKDELDDKASSAKIKKPAKRRRGKAGVDVPAVSDLESDDEVSQSYEISLESRDEFICKLLNKLYDCIPSIMKTKKTNPHIKQRVLKLIRTCVSMYPETAPEPHDLKVGALFDFVESCRDDVDITLFISGLATIGDVVSRFPQLHFYAMWYGTKDAAKYLGKESHVSKNHWHLRYIDASRCSTTASNVVRQLSSAKSKIHGATVGSGKSRLKRLKKKRIGCKRKRPTATNVDETRKANRADPDCNEEELSNPNKGRLEFAKKVEDMSLMHESRRKNASDVCQHLKQGKFDTFIALLKGRTVSGSKDLSLSLCIFQEYSIGDALLECTKLLNGIEKILEPLLNEPEEFQRLVFLLRNTAIHIPSMKISYYRKRSGSRVALKNITAGLDLSLRRSQKCPSQVVDDLLHHSPNRMDMMIVQPMLQMNVLERRLLSVIRIRDPRYILYCKRLVDCTIYGAGALVSGSRPKDIYVKSFNKLDGTHELVAPDQNIRHIKLCLCEYTIVREGKNVLLEEKNECEEVKEEDGKISVEGVQGDNGSSVPLNPGDRIMARYRNSKRYYKGVVSEVWSVDNTVTVHFDDGDIDRVPFNHVCTEPKEAELKPNTTVEVSVSESLRAELAAGNDSSGAALRATDEASVERRRDNMFVSHSNRRRWMPGRVLKVNADGSVEVRVRISGTSHRIQMPRSMTRVPISVNNSPLPCGTRVLARASKSVSGLAYGSKWSNGRYKLGTIIAHSKSEKGFYIYTVAEEDGGEVLRNLRSHEMKVSTHSRLRRFGSMLPGNYGAKDDVVIAEVSQAFPSLDMGRTGKPGRIIPKDIMESEMKSVTPHSTAAENEVKSGSSQASDSSAFAKDTPTGTSEVGKGSVVKTSSKSLAIEKPNELASAKVKLVVPKVSIKWHIDPANPSSPITSSSDRERYDGKNGQTRARAPNRAVISLGAINRIQDFQFRETNPTVFNALSLMTRSLNRSGVATSSFFSIVRENSVQVEKTAPWGGESCNLCYNVLFDFGNGPETLPTTRSLDDEIGKLEDMSYKDLQRVAKSEGVKANQKQKKLLAVLKARVKASFETQPDRHGKSISNLINLGASNNKDGAKLTKLKFAGNGPVGSSSLAHNASVHSIDAGGEAEIEAQDGDGKIEKALKKFASQIEAKGKGIFSNSSVNAKFLLKLLLEKDTSHRKDIVCSAKLGHIVNVQLKKPLVVCGNDLPAWCNAIIGCAPFLLPVSVRRQWLGCTSLGVSRTIDWLQKHNKYLSSAREAVAEAERAHNAAIASSNEMQQVQAVALAAQAADRLHEAELKHHVGALRCDIVKVRHDEKLLEDGLFLMNVHAQSANKLEVQFIGENGFGDGVTQGFFSGIAKILQTRSVNKKAPMWAIDTTESEGVLGNKFGLIPKPFPPRHTDSPEMAKTRVEVLKRFNFLGRLMGKAHLDGYIVPLPLTTEFFSLVKGQKLPRSAIRLIEGKNGFMSGLLNVVTAMKRISKKDAGAVLEADTYFDMSGQELCNIFGDDFFTKRYSLSGRKEYASIKEWLSHMDLRFVDPTTISSIKISAPLNKAAILRKEMFAAQKAGNITLVKALMKKMQQVTKGGNNRTFIGSTAKSENHVHFNESENEKKVNEIDDFNTGVVLESKVFSKAMHGIPQQKNKLKTRGRSSDNDCNSSTSHAKKKRRRNSWNRNIAVSTDIVYSNENIPTAAAKQAPDELFPGGADHRVHPSRDSLNLYIDLIAQRWLQDGIKEQIEAFRDGLKDIIPLSKLSSFSANELRSMFCGEPVVEWDLDSLSQEILVPTIEMRESNVFQFLMKELVCMSNRDRARFLEFVTAIPRLTPGLAINVSFSMPDSGTLPTARTCTYDLYIPHYRSSKELRHALKIAVANGLEAGFHEGENATVQSSFFTSPQPSPMVPPSNSSHLGVEINSLPLLPPSQSTASSSASSSGQQSVLNGVDTAPLSSANTTAENNLNVNMNSPSGTKMHEDGCEWPGFCVNFNVSDVGSQLLVYWSGPNVITPRWFHGVVNHFTPEKGHYIIYPEDNDMQWHDLRTTKYRLLKRGE